MTTSQIRRGDIALAAVLTALGAILMWLNVSGVESTRVDSRSWLVFPVFAAVTLPIAFRRVHLPAVFGVTLAALAAHVAAFGWMVRCGAGLPVAVALAYAAGRLCPFARGAVGLALSLVVAALVLVRDSVAGLETMTIAAPLAAIAWGIGVLVQRRSATARFTADGMPARA